MKHIFDFVGELFKTAAMGIVAIVLAIVFLIAVFLIVVF